jgi:hypothetical protein
MQAHNMGGGYNLSDEQADQNCWRNFRRGAGMNKIGSSLLTLTLLLLAGFSASKPNPEDDNGHDSQKRPRGKFTISKETTYITGPRDKNGYIDYAAALNKRLRKGITPANNANVLLWKAFGPHPEGRKVSAEYFQAMGIEAPSERGDYFTSLSRFERKPLTGRMGPPRTRTDQIDDQLDRARERPWTEKEYPVIARWLKANEKPLSLVVKAARRPHYYSPLVSPKTKKGSAGLFSAQLPGIQKCREVARALVARAMLRVSQRKYDRAWQDLLACHRLGRLVGAGSSIAECLVGIWMEAIACWADLAFLDSARPQAMQIANYLRDLRKLPPLPPVADKVDLCDRLTFLDIIMRIDEQGFEYLEAVGGGQPSKGSSQADRLLKNIDWDPAMRNANRWYNRLVLAMRENVRTRRKKNLGQVEAELKTLKMKCAKLGDFIKELAEGKQFAEARGERVGNILIWLLLSHLNIVQDAADRAQQTKVNLTVAFALSWYQREHGHYPKKLEALAPKYLPQIPKDLFSGKALIYRPSNNGYLLYSVGVNGKDENGRGREDDPLGDDLSIRMPLPKREKK